MLKRKLCAKTTSHYGKAHFPTVTRFIGAGVGLENSLSASPRDGELGKDPAVQFLLSCSALQHCKSVMIHSRLLPMPLLAKLYTENKAQSYCCAKPCFGACVLAAFGSVLPACPPGPPFTACTADQAVSILAASPTLPRNVQSVPL